MFEESYSVISIDYDWKKTKEISKSDYSSLDRKVRIRPVLKKNFTGPVDMVTNLSSKEW